MSFLVDEQSRSRRLPEPEPALQDHMKLLRHADLVRQLTMREVVGRYRGSALGILWSLLTPLFMLAVFTFVFGTVFKQRWQMGPATEGDPSLAEFAIILFAGLIVFQLFSEVISRAPSLILSNANYVKKIVFPLETLSVVAVGSALFHALVSIVVLLVAVLLVKGHIPWTALLTPLVLAPFLAVILGLCWFLASLGVYQRDIGQILGPILNATMFLSPIFYPSSALPEWIQPWLALNPASFPVEQARDMLIFGRLPDFGGLIVYSIGAFAICWLGYEWFEKTKRGFADVL